MENKKILIDVDVFKEILINGWHLLPEEKQLELVSLGIYPGKTDSRNMTWQARHAAEALYYLEKFGGMSIKWREVHEDGKRKDRCDGSGKEREWKKRSVRETQESKIG